MDPTHIEISTNRPCIVEASNGTWQREIRYTDTDYIWAIAWVHPSNIKPI
jgi:hypothetical protein